MKTKKLQLYTALRSLDVPVAYRDTHLDVLPRINFSLVSHWSTRGSNRRHHQNLIWQIDYFSSHALEIEADDHLWGIIDAVESAGFHATDWKETVDIDEEEDAGVYRYWLEVR